MKSISPLISIVLILSASTGAIKTKETYEQKKTTNGRHIDFFDVLEPFNTDN